MPMPVMRRRAAAAHALALRSQRFIDAAASMQRDVLRRALIQYFDGTDKPNWKSKEAGGAVKPWTALFEDRVDEVFYAKLFESFSNDGLDEPAAIAWLDVLKPIAEGVFITAVESMPCAVVSRLMARGRAQRSFDNALKKHFGGLMQAALVPSFEDHHDTVH